MFYILYMHNHPDGDKSFCILQRSYRNIYFFIYRPDGDKSLCACAEGDITYFNFTDHPEDDKSLCALKAIQFISFIDLSWSWFISLMVIYPATCCPGYDESFVIFHPLITLNYLVFIPLNRDKFFNIYHPDDDDESIFILSSWLWKNISQFIIPAWFITPDHVKLCWHSSETFLNSGRRNNANFSYKSFQLSPPPPHFCIRKLFFFT